MRSKLLAVEALYKQIIHLLRKYS